MSSNRQAPLFVLSGPSGAGKTTVVSEVVRTCPYPLRRAITATTRDPRPGEQPEVDYHYWTVERFGQAISNHEMLESAVVFGRDSYGTPNSEVEPYRQNGIGVLLVIDVQGAAQVRANKPGESVTIFLDVPSIEELERRLRLRGSEDEARLARRLEAARRERLQASEFTHRVVNDTIPNAVRSVAEIIASEFTLRGF
jgi:guanylate kinase